MSRATNPLVNNTKSIHTKRDVIDPETGEIQSFTLNQRGREFVRDSDHDQSRYIAETGAALPSASKVFDSYEAAKIADFWGQRLVFILKG